MQIRFIMQQRNIWKMSIAELRPIVSLFNADAKLSIFEGRLRLLEDFEFVKLTFTKDWDRVSDVEILVEAPMDTEE